MTVEEFGRLLGDASPAVMLAIFLYALVVKRWVRLDREVIERDARIVALETEKSTAIDRITKERDEFKDLLFKAVNIGERAVRQIEDSNGK